jgi:hypothetical protein
MPVYICVGIYHHHFKVVVVVDAAEDVGIVLEPLRELDLVVLTVWSCIA